MYCVYAYTYVCYCLHNLIYVISACMMHILMYMPKTCVCIVANNYVNNSLNFSFIISSMYVAIALICTVCKQPQTSYTTVSADFCTHVFVGFWVCFFPTFEKSQVAHIR